MIGLQKRNSLTPSLTVSLQLSARRYFEDLGFDQARQKAQRRRRSRLDYWQGREMCESLDMQLF